MPSPKWLLQLARQVIERIFFRQKRTHRFEKSPPGRGIESLPHLTREKQFRALVIANENGLKSSRIRFVAPNDELLPFLDPPPRRRPIRVWLAFLSGKILLKE